MVEERKKDLGKEIKQNYKEMEIVDEDSLSLTEEESEVETKIVTQMIMKKTMKIIKKCAIMMMI